jgi:predicted  nucleic acid-binding Zn-ribbon protein
VAEYGRGADAIPAARRLLRASGLARARLGAPRERPSTDHARLLPMNADLEQLVVLQAQDLELKRLRQELADAPRRVAAAEAARTHAEANMTALRQSLAREETLRRSQEVDIAGRRSKIARLRQQMETATSAAQIAALEHEIQFGDHAIGELEDAELASLEKTDQLEAARGAAVSQLASATTAQETTRAEATVLTARHTSAIAATTAERTVMRTSVSSTDSGAAALSVYDRIAKAKGTAVSEAADHKCSACQMMIRPQRWNDLTGREHDDVLFTCETCGRMLFYDPRRDAPVRWTAGSRLAAAAQESAQHSTAPGAGPKPTTSVPASPKIAESA